MDTYHSDVIGCFMWDLHETSKRRSKGRSWRRTTETSWWRTTDTSLGVSFGTCLRRRGDVMIGRRCYVLFRSRHDVPIRRRGDVLLRRLVDVPSRRIWVLYLERTCDVAGMNRETSWRPRHKVLLPGGKAPLKADCVTDSFTAIYIKTNIYQN